MKLDDCRGAWHGSCYEQFQADQFPVLTPGELVDEIITATETQEDLDSFRFRFAREGDHLMCPFQCDWCQFINVKKRRPAGLPGDDVLALCIRRANLDACWSRETSTVAQNLWQFQRVLKSSLLLGTNGGYTSRGPFPVEDTFGMEIAAHHLLRSLDGGRNAQHIQFQTMRQLRSHFSNFYHTTPYGVGMATAGADGSNMFFSNSPTNSYWFKRFMLGSHRRMGDIWVPDRALTIDELLKALELLEEDWVDYAHDISGKLQVALLAAALSAGFSGGLRGEEIPRADLGLIRENWEEALNHPRAPHIPWAMVGRFKTETGEKVFYQPLAIISKSGIENGKWVRRVIDSYAELGIVSGPMFRVKKKGGGSQRCRPADLDPDFHSVLLRVQARWPTILPSNVDVVEEYKIRRSLRRGSTTQAGNMAIPKEIVEANNRWRKHGNSRGMLPGMSMVERYSDAKASIQSLLRYSIGL
jgi:hypothetical protein